MLSVDYCGVQKKLLLLCGNAPDALHMCSVLVQNNYIVRHNASLQVLFLEMLRDLGLADSVLRW